MIFLIVATFSISCVDTQKEIRSTKYVKTNAADTVPFTLFPCNYDTIFGNYHLLQPGLLKIFSEIPSELGILMNGAEAKNGKQNKIFPAIFNASISTEDFLRGDTLKYNWNSDTIIWENTTSAEIISAVDEFCTILSGCDNITATDIFQSNPAEISHTKIYTPLNDQRIVNILKQWNEIAIETLFFTDAKLAQQNSLICDGSYSKYGRIVIKNGKLTELKYIIGIRVIKNPSNGKYY